MISSNPKRILISDNNRERRTVLGLMLDEEGYEVSQAASCKEAIALHDGKPFDLVITELELDGFETMMELRRHPSPVKVIAIFNTSWMTAELCRRMGEHLGAHCVLTKPFPPELLLTVVRSALD
jgi:DNA-binding response OmpR family regulator